MQYASVASNSSLTFTHLGGLDPRKALDCNDGYVYYSLEVTHMPYTSNSDLLIAHTATVFTPGHVARINGVKHDGNDYLERYLNETYVHLTWERSNANGNTGGRISPKAMWPQSNSFTTTISTVSGTSYKTGITSGFEMDLEGNATLKSTSTNELTFSYQKTASTTFSDPTVSAQYGASSFESQWNYKFVNWEVSGAVSYACEQYVMFELVRDGDKGIGEHSFTLVYNVDLLGSFYGFLNLPYMGKHYQNTIRISCFH